MTWGRDVRPERLYPKHLLTCYLRAVNAHLSQLNSVRLYVLTINASNSL